MKQLIILGGANGSGKSTFAAQYIAETGFPFLNADEIQRQEATHSAFNAGRIFFDTFNEWLQKEQSFIVESTLSGKYLSQYIQKAKDKGYHILLVYVFLENPNLCIDRIRIRVMKGGHFIPNDVVERRYFRSLKLFWKTYRFLADDWIMYHNAHQEMTQIAFGKSDVFVVQNIALFKAFENALENNGS
jgi:predicted ABC-type ATPase